jgi:hypothetical protein
MANLSRLADGFSPKGSSSREGRLWFLDVLTEIIGFSLLYGIYLLLAKVLFPSADALALRNADVVLSLSDGLGLSWERIWQRWAIDAGPLVVRLFNWYYLLAFWPSILSLAVFTYIRHRNLYRYYRTLVVLTIGWALIIFSVFPVAPPRMIPGFIDTIQVYGPSFYGGKEMLLFYNPVASTPSLHFSWTVLSACVLRGVVSGYLRHLVLAYPAIHFLSIVVTGNHYILDAVAGLIVIGLALTLYKLARRADLKVLV